METYAEVHYKKKSRGCQERIQTWEGRGCCRFSFFLGGVFLLKSLTGGGKCPEEEHTTCSGGPTILVTSAVYGERDISKI
jgi:hypothetical protein